MPWLRRLPLAPVALLACLTASCARRSTPTAPRPAIAVAEATTPRLATTDSVRAIPLSDTGTPPRTGMRIAIREGRMDAASLRPPPLYVVDDVVLGRRSDGTVDHVAAARSLQQLDPKRITSIEVIKEASNRFGPDGVNGVVIFTMIKETSPSVPKAP